MNEAVNPWVCDGCGKTVETPQDDRGSAMPSGWIHLAVTGPPELLKAGDFHSKPCAAAWLVKRERRAKAKDEVTP